MTGTGAAARRLLHDAVVPALLVLILWRVLGDAFSQEQFGIRFIGEGGIRIKDFASHLTFAKAFWLGKAGYDVESHLRITSQWAGRSVGVALPFGYSPTMLWILAPLCVLPTVWGFALWTLAGGLAAWWMSRPRWSLGAAAAVLSPVAMGCFALGQTALVTTAGLLMLMSQDLDDPGRTAPDRRAASAWRDAIVLWALTAKPPLALTGATALLAGRRFRPLVLALGLTVLSTVALTPALGIGWMREYAHLATHYERETADPAFAWSFVPGTMSNLRALLHVALGMSDSAASHWSSGLWLLVLAGIVATGIGRVLPAQASWGFAALAYLLLCPHVSWTEELLLVLILALVARTTPPAAAAVRWAVLGLILVSLYLLPGVLYQLPDVVGRLAAFRLPAVFATQVLLVGLVWAQWLSVPRRQ